jgi:ethanolamine utilization microcompartment shell protein EutS
VTGATGPQGPQGPAGSSGSGSNGGNITVGDWDINVGTYNGGSKTGLISNVLTFSQGGSTIIAMANDGANATGMQINAGSNGGLDLASGGFTVDAGNIDVQSGEIGIESGNLNVNSGSVFVNGNVNANDVFAKNINQSSDRNLKEKFAAINPMEILDRVVAMPISSWNFKQDTAERHIGPMAQDFYAAFNVGMDDKHIATVDEGGVALAAIQGLNEKLQEKDTEIKALEKRMADLEALLKSSNHP